MRDYQTWGKQYMKLALTGFMEKRMSCGGARKLGLFFFFLFGSMRVNGQRQAYCIQFIKPKKMH